MGQGCEDVEIDALRDMNLQGPSWPQEQDEVLAGLVPQVNDLAMLMLQQWIAAKWRMATNTVVTCTWLIDRTQKVLARARVGFTTSDPQEAPAKAWVAFSGFGVQKARTAAERALADAERALAILLGMFIIPGWEPGIPESGPVWIPSVWEAQGSAGWLISHPQDHPAYIQFLKALASAQEARAEAREAVEAQDYVRVRTARADERMARAGAQKALADLQEALRQQ